MIVPSLLVRNGRAAVAFYKAAFGAVEVSRFEAPDGTIYAALNIAGARVFVGDEQSDRTNFSPQSLGGTTVAIDLLMADPMAVQERR